MEFEHEEEEALQPMSPTAEYLKSSALSFMILAVLEMEIPIDDTLAVPMLNDVFLPINPRFSCIMVTQNKGVKKWKKVEVNVSDHIITPTFKSGMSVEYYDKCFNEYLSNLATQQFPTNKPLWELHIIKYPTKNAAGNVIFKLHHSLGDGYSLMGALLSCLQRMDNPLLPLSFPSRQSTSRRTNARGYSVFGSVFKFVRGISYTAYDLCWSVMKSSLIEDDKSPIRSNEDGVEFLPMVTITTTFSMDRLKQIKNKLKVTINDVITGIIFSGTRMYMQKMSQESGVANSTALVMLNTRALGGNYKSIKEMIRPDAEMPWGNRFAFLQIPIPKLTKSELENPLKFVTNARNMIKRQRNSATIYLTGQLLSIMRKLGGAEATARYIHGTLKNASMSISNLMGPLEKMSLADHPIKGLYFVVPGPPQSITVTMVSYVETLRIAMTMEKDFMDPDTFKSCMEHAFEVIYKAALDDSPPSTT
ncbi:hypothetical protein ACJIZ3_010724 [Penstemon smallii]|uniref:Diacylglycerol O-acyltransferase n=1 Tax=Penstemon smallii TaxID=265156 RepID=A0ABD3UKS9_9LAMI